ncbi:hypothetical protein [Actinoplanes sp. NPDC026619]|uniref:hypothetical protein n=1 Tax=Actinoplanes sp. NPDC026619 TaxID=3155798 RepID=UPI0033D6BA9D
MPSVTDELIQRLYEEPPDGFVAARTAAINEAKESGDRDAAKRLAALKKPTVAAWVVNLLALRRPELIDDLVELSAELREAQRGLKGDQLRELTAQRRQVVAALVDAARRLAMEASGPGAKLPLGEVEATLTAALAEPTVAAQVRTGRLIRAASYAGFGEVPRPRLRLVTDEDESAEGSEGPDDAEVVDFPQQSARDERRRREFEQKRRELRRELGTAQADEKRADERLEKSEAAERDAEHLVEDLDAELAELERRRTEAQADVARRKQGRRAAERETAVARRRVGDVQAALEDLESDEPD